MGFLFLFLFALLHPLLSTRVANAERKLPADLQVDLIFPRDNETYAPTQYFPIVFGINNLDAVWPLSIQLSVEVRSRGMSLRMPNRPLWATQWANLYYSDIEEAFEQAPSKHFFHFPAVNMTNGTTDSYSILWDFYIAHQCFANNTDPQMDTGRLPWTNDHGGSESRLVEFSTAPGAQLPDIEAVVNSCPERNGNNSVAVRVTQVRTTYDDGQPCPVLETTVKPDECAFKSAAKELAANVSTAMLDKMRCDEGDWRTITAPCARVKSMALPQSAGFGVGWVLLALAIAVSNVL